MTGMIGMKKLPDRPSDLLELALRDLKACEKDSVLYEVDMGWWHDTSIFTDKCVICMAGAVMAKSLGAAPTNSMKPHWYDRDTHTKLEAIDDLRTGYVDRALSLMDISGAITQNRTVTPYRASPERFKDDMAVIVRSLREEGL